MFGLWRVEGISDLLGFILPEVIVIASIMGHLYYEQLIGLYEKSELEVENIHQARDRFIY